MVLIYFCYLKENRCTIKIDKQRLTAPRHIIKKLKKKLIITALVTIYLWIPLTAASCSNNGIKVMATFLSVTS